MPDAKSPERGALWQLVKTSWGRLSSLPSQHVGISGKRKGSRSRLVAVNGLH